jgi:hypothetical protein
VYCCGKYTLNIVRYLPTGLVNKVLAGNTSTHYQNAPPSNQIPIPRHVYLFSLGTERQSLSLNLRKFDLSPYLERENGHGFV